MHLFKPFSESRPNGKTAIILNKTDFIYQIKIESLLAFGLLMNGWKVKVLLNSPRDLWALRYFKLAGANDFLYWCDYKLSWEDRRQIQNDKQGFTDNPLTMSAVKEWTYDDCWIGPQVMASVARILRQGALDFSDSKVIAQFDNWLSLSLENVIRAKKFFNANPCDLLIVCEANYARNGPITDISIRSGATVVQVAQTGRDDAFSVRRLNKDTRRDHPSSVSIDTMSRLNKEAWTEKEEIELWKVLEDRYNGKWFLQRRNQRDVKKSSRDDLLKELNIDPCKKVVTVFSHVLWDANLFYGEDLFEDYGDWFAQTVKAAYDNSNVNWIIKLHPANVWKREREQAKDILSEITIIESVCGPISEAPAHIKILYPDTDVSTHSLFAITDYGITVRGTVSTELPCFGIPVFTAGTGRAHGHGFTVNSVSKEDYLQKMARIQDFGPLSADQIMLAKRHAHTAFCRRPWQIKSFKTEFMESSSGMHPLDHNLSLTVNSLDELRNNDDLGKWARWAEDQKSIDYLDH